MTKRNIAESAGARLANRARADGRPFQELLEYFAMERFLFRLGRSRHGAHFVLKGGLILQLWSERPRSTRDIDLLGLVAATIEAVADVVREILAERVDADGPGKPFPIQTIEVRRKLEAPWAYLVDADASALPLEALVACVECESCNAPELRMARTIAFAPGSAVSLHAVDSDHAGRASLGSSARGRQQP